MDKDELTIDNFLTTAADDQGDQGDDQGDQGPTTPEEVIDQVVADTGVDETPAQKADKKKGKKKADDDEEETDDDDKEETPPAPKPFINAPKTIQSGLDTAGAASSRGVDWLASRPTPGGVGLLIFALLFFLWAIIPVDDQGHTRLNLLWLVITGQADFKEEYWSALSGVTPGSGNDGGGGFGNGGGPSETTTTGVAVPVVDQVGAPLVVSTFDDFSGSF